MPRLGLSSLIQTLFTLVVLGVIPLVAFELAYHLLGLPGVAGTFVLVLYFWGRLFDEG